MQPKQPLEAIRLAEKLAQIQEPWQPRILAELNGQHVKLARLEGAFEWHSHAEEDELFLVLEGHLKMHYRDRTLELAPGELCVVPRGVEHRPEGSPAAGVLLFEPTSTVNTGENPEGDFTHTDLEWI